MTSALPAHFWWQWKNYLPTTLSKHVNPLKR